MNIKARIQEKECLSPDYQRLIYDGKVLENGSKLRDYNIQEKSTLYLSDPRRCDMQIFVKMPTGKTIVLKVEASNTIEKLKNKIQGREGIPIARQQLMYAGRHLENERTFYYYNISKESNLFLDTR